MSQVVVTICDRCGARDLPSGSTINIPTGESRDPVDGRSSTDYESLDLCAKCIVGAFNCLVQSISHDAGLVLVATLKRPKK